MATITATPRLKHLLVASVSDAAPKEHVTYAVICEFLLEHKAPKDRFVLFPQMSLQWKPTQVKDNRAEIADLGAEAKRSIPDVMRSLPDPWTIDNNDDVKIAFHLAFFQGEDQAKAVIKGGYAYSTSQQYLIFVGPYWTPANYGPFSATELEIRTHKPSSSGDFWETAKASRRLAEAPIRRPLYLLGTEESARRLEEIIKSTDAAAQFLRNEAATYT